jgi:hypothetical protein
MLLIPRLNTSGCVFGQTVIFKTASLLVNNIWTTGCTWLPEMSTQSPAVIHPFTVIIGPAEYQDIAAQITADPPPCFTVGTRSSLLWASVGIQPDAGYNVTDGSPDHLTFPVISRPGFIFVTPSFFQLLLLLLDL